MNEPQFIWTPKLTKRLFELRFENEWLFRTRKQPWHEFRNILLQKGFPKEMTLNHVRKKWSYTYDSYKIAKKTKNKSWKYYKMFDRHFGKSPVLDKYETWSDEWRARLISCITDAKELNLDVHNTWKQVEKSLRCLNLPSDCCIQDVKGLWQHLRITFNRKHRVAMRKGEESSEWALYEPLLHYYVTFDKELLRKVETERVAFPRTRRTADYPGRRRAAGEVKEESEFQWSKDITESFIQIRLQNDWIFREKKWAWNDLQRIMVQEYGFPNTLTNREICRKWNSTYSDYQKALATNNTSWVYYNLFECYFGEGSFSFNPLIGWNEEWILKLIEARTELEHLFINICETQNQLKNGWREVEKKLREEGLPLDHSLFDIPEIWTHLVKTYRWKRKFADKGMLSEHWPYFDAMTKYTEILKTFDTPKLNIKKFKYITAKEEDQGSFDDLGTVDDDFDDDDIKLFDLKQKILKPKKEKLDIVMCRACNAEDGSYNIFEACDEEGLDLAHKLRIIAGIEIDKSDNLPKQICFNCLRELENAFSFRRKCQDAEREQRCNNINSHNITEKPIKQEIKLDDVHHHTDIENNITADEADFHDFDPSAFDNDCPSDADIFKREIKPFLKKEIKKKLVFRKKKKTKAPKVYRKMCEICGKSTSNLRGHLDMHSAGKAYSCDICDKKFKFKSGLQIHRAIHDPTPKKTCEVCGKTFHIMAQYRRHFVYHANERKYSCETCGKSFNTIDILRVHQRMHTDERPFSCVDCGKTFRTAGCVSRHRRIVHKKISKTVNTTNSTIEPTAVDT